MIFASPLGYYSRLHIGQTKDFKLPPIDFNDKSRCQFSSSKMGQANAARDKLYDLRQCNLQGEDASGFDLSGVIMVRTPVPHCFIISRRLTMFVRKGQN